MAHVKDSRVCAYRTLTHRNVEDWREEDSPKGHGPWAVHCLDHDRRGFVDTYRKAKDSASMPAICPVCETFDQRCVHCPSDRDQWKVDPATGFTRSTGHIMGNAVCSHHKYGSIPGGATISKSRTWFFPNPLLKYSLDSHSSAARYLSLSIRQETAGSGFGCTHPPNS